MEDIKVVFYVILGIIFVVSRILKSNKGSQKAPPQRRRPAPNAGGNPQQRQRNKPATFEDLLKEFAEEATAEAPSRQPAKREAPKPREPKYEEGRTRRFSDDESRKIYEESVKRAEGFDIDFSADDSFKSIRTKFGEGAVKKDLHKKNPIIASIKSDLKDKQSIKKAFILSEVLNRKY